MSYMSGAPSVTSLRIMKQYHYASLSNIVAHRERAVISDGSAISVISTARNARSVLYSGTSSRIASNSRSGSKDRMRTRSSTMSSARRLSPARIRGVARIG